MRVSRLDCIVVNLGIFQHDNVFIHRGANARHVSTVKYVTIRVMKNTFIKNGRIARNNEEKERARFEIRRRICPFLPIVELPLHKSANKAGRLPHLLRQLSTSLRREKKTPRDGPGIGLAKTPFANDRSRKTAMLENTLSHVRIEARSRPVCLPLKLRKGYTKIRGARREFLIPAHVWDRTCPGTHACARYQRH